MNRHLIFLMKQIFAHRLCFLIFILFYFPTILIAQKRLSKSDITTYTRLKTHVSHLTTDSSTGRRTGTEEEKQAAFYIQEQFKTYGLLPHGDNGTYLQQFTIREGNELHASSFLMLDGTTFTPGSDFIVFPWSSIGSVTSLASPVLQEKESPWFWDLKELLEQHTGSPSTDLENLIYNRALEVQQKGASALLLYNSSGLHAGIRLLANDTRTPLSIPVLFLLEKPTLLLNQDLLHTWDLALRIQRVERTRTGTNVIGFMDFGAPSTILITAHYDQLVEDELQIPSGILNRLHNNGSGTAALIEMARLLQKGPATNNYLFIAFSGEEQGFLGSRHFLDHPVLAREQINCMLNVDGVGCLNDSTKQVCLSGFQSSPSWQQLFPKAKKPIFRLVPDSSAADAYLQSPFHQQKIPALFLHTGYQKDYQSRMNSASKINLTGTVSLLNYLQRIIKNVGQQGKLEFQMNPLFSETPQPFFSVTMGIQPDYDYKGVGIHIKNVFPYQSAEAAGIQSGDVLLKLGSVPVSTIQTYRDALSEYKPGDLVQVLIRRNQQEQSLFVRF